MDMSRRHPNNPSDVERLREARALWLAKEGANQRDPAAPEKKFRRRGPRVRGRDIEAQRLDAVARWLVSDEK